MIDPSSILTTILSNFTKLFPFRVVTIHTYEQGVKFRGGIDINRCSAKTGAKFPWFKKQFPFVKWTSKTGVHFHWALIEEIEIVSCVEDVIETEFQTVTTKDGKEMTVSLSVKYQIFNARHYWTRVTNFAASMENICQGVITTQISNSSYQEITTDPESINENVLSALKDEVFPWGVDVLSVKLVNNAKTSSMRIFGESNYIPISNTKE